MLHNNQKLAWRVALSFSLFSAFAFPTVVKANEETAPVIAEEKEPIVIEVAELRRPSEEFLNHGDVIGISKSLLDRMEIKEGDPIFVRTPVGSIFAFRTKIYGDHEDRIYAKKTLREIMNLSDGKVKLHLTPAVWGDGPSQVITGTFTDVSRPPKDFLKFGDAVGVSTNTLLQAKISPGWQGIVSGPGGSKNVVIQLLERGDSTISMKKTIREEIGVTDGSAEVTLKVRPRPDKKSDTEKNGEE